MKDQLQTALDLLNSLPSANRKLINDIFGLAKAIYDHRTFNGYKLKNIAILIDNLLDTTIYNQEPSSFSMMMHIIENYYGDTWKILDTGNIYFWDDEFRVREMKPGRGSLSRNLVNTQV